MKIGQFSDSFLPIVDGVGRVVYNYCDSLGRKGHEVSAIVPMEDMGYRGRFPFEVIDYYSQTVPMTVYNAGLPLLDAHYDKMLEMKNFDIVHVHTPFIAGIEAVKYCKNHNVPLVASFHSKYYDDFLQITGSKYIAKFGTDVLVNFYNKCDEVWTVSENSAETLKFYGYDRPITIIQNGMDIKDIDYTLAIKARKHFNLSFDPVLLYVGQMNWKKNIECILKACALLKSDGIKFQLVLAGKGPHFDEIDKKAKELGIKPLAKIVSYASAGLDPAIMGYGPFYATKKALEKVDLDVKDLDLIEANEAFATQSLAVAKDLGFDMSKVNVNGGATALGHPVGASGARILVTLLYAMKKRGAKKGLATLCIGGGQGTSLIVEM